MPESHDQGNLSRRRVSLTYSCRVHMAGGTHDGQRRKLRALLFLTVKREAEKVKLAVKQGFKSYGPVPLLTYFLEQGCTS